MDGLRQDSIGCRCLWGEFPQNGRTVFKGSLMSTEAGPNVNPLIWTAIEQSRLLRLRYKTASALWSPIITGFTMVL